jgi:hypothetical protein
MISPEDPNKPSIGTNFKDLANLLAAKLSKKDNTQSPQAPAIKDQFARLPIADTSSLKPFSSNNNIQPGLN